MSNGTGVHPEGTDWVCGCGERYPADYEPVRCVCGGILTRVLARLTIPASENRV
jgi:hypothetical protein